VNLFPKDDDIVPATVDELKRELQRLVMVTSREPLRPLLVMRLKCWLVSEHVLSHIDIISQLDKKIQCSLIPLAKKLGLFRVKC
jgi:hypothetical protein